jgi:PPOX class probable F420-dependent enzyme
MLDDPSQTQQSDPFASLYPYKYVQFTTYRKTGVGVPTPVGFAPLAGKLYITTPGTASKLKRIRHNARVTLAPCKYRGEVLGESVEGQARILPPEERARAEQAFVQKYGVIYRIELVLQKMRNRQRTYIEIQPVQD